MMPGKQSVTVQEAAQLLGTTEGGVRKRIQRGSLEAEKGADGRVYVWVDAGETRHDKRQDTGHTAASGVEEELRARIESLERQLEEANTRDRENRRLLAAALERMPELEAGEPNEERPQQPPATSEGPESGEATTGSQRGAQRRSWWRRIFGG